MITYKEWFYDYGDYELTKHLADLEEDGESTDIDEDKWLEDKYESMIGDYEDYAYEQYKDEQRGM